MNPRERAAGMVMVVGALFLGRGAMGYFQHWMQRTCPCCNVAATPFDTVGTFASVMVFVAFAYLWQITVLRWAKGADAPAGPTTARAPKARAVAALVSALSAGGSWWYIRASMRAACPCCDVDRWPFELVRDLAALVPATIVYSLLGLVSGRRAKKSHVP